MLVHDLQLLIRYTHIIWRRWNVNDFTLRSHTCGELRIDHQGQNVILYGWLAHKRMNRFLVLRDAYGSVQVRVPDNREDLVEKLKPVNCESVLKVDGMVADRGKKYRNPRMQTGDVEILANDLELLNPAPAEYPIEQYTTEFVRQKYRYLDIRRPQLQRVLRLRSAVVHGMRRYLCERQGFVEVETPTLFRRTPGGAKEFIVPAPKPNIGKFYSLPQSPQQFKQLLMCGGLDRYFQIARCYRDEQSKMDRQFEFTQLDVELSFTDADSVMKLIEGVILESWPEELEQLKPSTPFRRMKFAKAERLYGTDKPDLRIPWTIEDCTDELLFLSNTNNFKAKAFVAKGGASVINDTNINEWQRLLQVNKKTQEYRILLATDKAWFRQIPNSNLIDKFGIKLADAAVISWGDESNLRWTLGQLRNYIAEAMGFRRKESMEFIWITHFPLFVRNNEGQLESAHHPFTSPIIADQQLLYDPNKLLQITGQHYDLVLNGVELGGGSIRLHNPDTQRHILANILGEPVEELNHLLEALSYGAPPHGGFAIGLDRYIAVLAGRGDTSVPIRDVIAFPKSKEGNDLISGSPVLPSKEQLERYGITVKSPAIDQKDKGKENDMQAEGDAAQTGAVELRENDGKRIKQKKV